MNIIVLLKQVPDTTEMKVDKETGTLIRAGVPTIINPDDLAGFEAALQLKDNMGAKVTCITMGPPQAESMLKELYAMGADEAILISDGKFGGADTWATSNTLTAVLKDMPFDLIIAGRQAIDGDTAQVGPQTAEKLGIPQVTYVEEIMEFGNGVIKVKKSLEDSYEIMEATLPALITTLSSIAKPRYMRVKGITDSFKKGIKKLTFNDVDIDPAIIGLKGSPTKVKKTFTKEVGTSSQMYNLSSEESAKKIAEILFEKQYISK